MSENKVKFKYVEGDGQGPKMASGMMATPMPDGRFLLRFFVEYPTLQKSETWNTEQGKLSNQLEIEVGDAQITRRIVSEIVLDKNTVSGMVAALNNMMKNNGNPGGNDAGHPPMGFRR